MLMVETDSEDCIGLYELGGRQILLCAETDSEDLYAVIKDLLERGQVVESLMERG